MRYITVGNLRVCKKLLDNEMRYPLVARSGIVLFHERGKELLTLGKELVKESHTERKIERKKAKDNLQEKVSL